MRLVPAGLVVAALVFPSTARAQYFGRNNVQYRHLDFRIIETAHFDVYYYPEERTAALDAARMAERAYARLSRILDHQYRERQPIIVFASHTEFQQNNLIDVDESTGGVTEPFRQRIMVPFTGSYADFEHVLQHEMVHQFQYDIFARGHAGASIDRLIAVQPPLWLMEGMAEYLSIGDVDPLTAMWLKNAALEGHLPTIDQLASDPTVFPYRYGQALWAYIAKRWGDDVIGEILRAVASSGVDDGFRRTLGVSLHDLSAEWRESVQRTYLPELANRQQARDFARLAVDRERSGGRLHVSPAISPDGRLVAYFSEGNSFFVDLYVAEAATGHVVRRLAKSAFSTAFENLRYLYSSGSWSPDGRYFAIAVKHGGRDDIVIFDAIHGGVARRITPPLNGVKTPAWSPDGTRLVFTGYDGGLSDLFIVNADGTGLTRLTHDRYADLQPAWSPDGTTIAFATDRGSGTDLDELRFAPLGIALYDIATHAITLLPTMAGLNINPQWAPDGRSLAYVSDRTGTPNVFLYDLGDRQSYQLTDVYTGIAGITALSPAISWAHDADRLAFSYYHGDDFSYEIYVVNNPRTLRGTPWVPPGGTAVAAGDGADTANAALERERSVYRSPAGFRASSATPRRATGFPTPISVRALLDSATLALPDTADFSFKPYSASLKPDFVAQPSIGYTRDNFGNGFYGGSAIALSDMLGNRHLLLAGQVNGRIEEAQILAQYANFGHRVNWTVGGEQYPLFFYSGSYLSVDSAGTPAAIYDLDRYIVRSLFVGASRPFTRFRRIEFGLRATNVDRARQQYIEYLDPTLSYVIGADVVTDGLGHTNYVQPSVALVFDNSVARYVGPFLGRRSRFEYAPAFGDWQFHQILGDYRRYDHLVGPFTLATRELVFGRFGRDDDLFPVFLGTPELLRGYTFGSFQRNECKSDAAGSISGCAALDQLIGSRIAVFNAELRFPLVHNTAPGVLPAWFPPVEGAIFFDAGMAWRSGSELAWSRDSTQNPDLVRTPLTSWGFSGRMNLLGFIILRFDYAKPLARANQSGYWTVSLGPTF